MAICMTKKWIVTVVYYCHLWFCSIITHGQSSIWGSFDHFHDDESSWWCSDWNDNDRLLQPSRHPLDHSHCPRDQGNHDLREQRPASSITHRRSYPTDLAYKILCKSKRSKTSWHIWEILKVVCIVVCIQTAMAALKQWSIIAVVHHCRWLAFNSVVHHCCCLTLLSSIIVVIYHCHSPSLLPFIVVVTTTMKGNKVVYHPVHPSLSIIVV